MIRSSLLHLLVPALVLAVPSPGKPLPTKVVKQLINFDKPQLTDYYATPIPTPYENFVFKPAFDAPDTFAEIYRPCSQCSGHQGVVSPEQLLSAVLGSIVITSEQPPKQKCQFDLESLYIHVGLPEDPAFNYTAKLEFKGFREGRVHNRTKTLYTKDWTKALKFGKTQLGPGWDRLDELEIRVTSRSPGRDFYRQSFTVDDLAVTRRCTKLPKH